MNVRTQLWYPVDNIDKIDTPSLLVYEERVLGNIRRQVARAKGKAWLRPHVKTNKMAEVCKMMMDESIDKFKCATIVEAGMLGSIGAADVLLAYPLCGPKVERYIDLIKRYPDTKYASLVDSVEGARQLAVAAAKQGITLDVWIDVNVGMNRTGVSPSDLAGFYADIITFKELSIIGLHLYDGHLHDADIEKRKTASDKAFDIVEEIWSQINNQHQVSLRLVAGGTPTFPIHNARAQVEASPGTFVFWDWGYEHILPEQEFDFAALVATRVISIVDEHTICTDLGHKSIAAETPLPRVHFLNAPEAKPIGQSEEHLVLSVEDARDYHIGEVLYGVPVHICPTVALYEVANVVRHGRVVEQWAIARQK
ncbi:D-TA family PLP-dependent enzyme [Olivibacter sitiensis]|uniref:D-TA family PLP-dependent enzyme n=1 Tax=Olivibacter sitiensis TaxID=376470 RepID=UPI00041BE6CB|nr:D-TA family PLP-dependent enzyme [Olivibacter sitiensis]